MISQTSEYALRAVVCLANHPDESLTAQTVAEQGKVPAGYMSKVLQALTRAGIVRSRRGLRGGFVLERPPAELTVLQVVNAVDPVRRIRACPLGHVEHHGQLCALHACLDEASHAVEATFERTTIEALLATVPGAVRPLRLDSPGTEERRLFH